MAKRDAKQAKLVRINYNIVIGMAQKCSIGDNTEADLMSKVEEASLKETYKRIASAISQGCRMQDLSTLRSEQ